MKKTIPDVSIVIPMYNSEKYIGECLDSILAQTFKDYEVVIVDDCSTDKSCDVVKSYMPKFKGQSSLNLVHSDKNSGGIPSIPRNLGIRLSSGEYILFVDSDDAITPTALEELYSLAKKFDADVVHCGNHYSSDEIISTDKNSLKTFSLAVGTLVTKPQLLPDNLAERVKLFVERRINWITFCNFVRRNFLMKSQIDFPKMCIAEDVPYTFRLLCESKNFLCLPNLVYIYRMRENSQSHANLDVEKLIHNRFKAFFVGLEYLIEYMNEIDFFATHPSFKHAVLEFFYILQAHDVLPLYEKVPAFKVDKLIQREFAEIKDKSTLTALTAFLFSRMNVFNVQLIRQGAYIQQLQAQLAAK